MIDQAFTFIYTVISSTVSWLLSNYITTSVTVGGLIMGFFMFNTLIKVFYLVK